ncbi:MAG TPA: hypothetical protein VII50_08615, partial [Acidothermaceae bacterium]
MSTSTSDPTERSESPLLEMLGVAEDPMGAADPVSFLRSLAAMGPALLRNPAGVAAANARLAVGWASAAAATIARTFGVDAPGPVSPEV